MTLNSSRRLRDKYCCVNKRNHGKNINLFQRKNFQLGPLRLEWNNNSKRLFQGEVITNLCREKRDLCSDKM